MDYWLRCRKHMWCTRVDYVPLKL